MAVLNRAQLLKLQQSLKKNAQASNKKNKNYQPPKPKQSQAVIQTALEMVNNARRGILINLRKEPEMSLNYDIDRVISLVQEMNEYRKNASVRNNTPDKSWPISQQDIKAVIFSSIVKLPLENEQQLKKGMELWKMYAMEQVSLEDKLGDMSRDLIYWSDIKGAYSSAKDKIKSFLTNIDDVGDFINVSYGYY